MNKAILAGTVIFSLAISKLFFYFFSKTSLFNIFSADSTTMIPGFTLSLAKIKSLDIIEFIVFILLSIGIYFLHRRLTRPAWNFFNIAAIVYVLVSLAFLTQILFVGFSGSLMLIFFVIFHLLFWLANLFKLNLKFSWNFYRFLNGLILSFVLIQLVQKFNYSLFIPLFLLLLIPIIYCSVKLQFLANPYHLILSLFIFRPGDINFLGTLLLLTILALFISKIYSRTDFHKFLYSLYPYVLITLITFNPLYYWGSLDVIEEGFWLAWVQRLLTGDTLYRDVMVYHPPLLIWLLKYFLILFGTSVANVKLFFHLLQIIAYFIFYILIKHLIKSQFGRLVCITMIISLSPNLVKNNFEIRLAVGLLALIPLIYYLKRSKNIFLLLSGMITGLSLLTSVETGLVTLISIFAYLIYFLRQKSIRPVLNYVSGIVMVLLPFSLYQFSQGALFPMIDQIGFYADAFSKGYFNTPVPRFSLSPLLDWRIVSGHFNTVETWWLLSEIIISASVLFSFFHFKLSKNTPISDHLAFILSILGLILFRTALGRSDWYHLFFPLTICLFLYNFMVDRFFKNSFFVFFSSFMIYIFVINNVVFHQFFFYDQVLKFQSYGRIPGHTTAYASSRFKIAVDQGTDTTLTDSLIAYLDQLPKDQMIFAFPSAPDIYFIADRKNATSVDTPYAFFSDEYQNKTVAELKNNPGTKILFRPNFAYGNMTPDKLPIINDFLLQNYIVTKRFGDINLLELKPTL